jgi:hypothetical protein
MSMLSMYYIYEKKICVEYLLLGFTGLRYAKSTIELKKEPVRIFNFGKSYVYFVNI